MQFMKKILFTLFSLVLLLEANPIATLETSKGNIKIELRADLAPKAVENFVTHSKNVIKGIAEKNINPLFINMGKVYTINIDNIYVTFWGA